MNMHPEESWRTIILPMTPEAASCSINSLLRIVTGARGRTLTVEEREELRRQCRVLDEGIPCRPIYNRVARDLCARLTSPVVLENAVAVDDVLEEIEGLRLMTG
jgi:hypothetical protein